MNSFLKTLIWIYVVLLLAEGALRKWVFPQFADELLVVRDPVLLLLYAVALARGQFPRNGFVVFAGGMAVLSALASVLGGHTNVLVILYGIRINYLHLPLIWIMGAVLDRRDVERIGAFLLVGAIPMVVLMVAQFRAPMDAFINRGVGTEEIGQLFGADNRIRPPGLFSFITGPQLYFPLCAAFFFDELGGGKRLHWYLLIACGLAIAIGLPISISRTVMLGTGLVGLAFVVSRLFTSGRTTAVVRPLLLLLLVGAALTQLPVFREATTVFMMRWDEAAGDEAATSTWTNVIDRSVNGFTNPYFFIQAAPLLGHGIGTGSNVGARLTSGAVGFSLAEEEWGKVLLELGPVLGTAFILFRLTLVVWLARPAWRALRRDRNALPLLLWSATAAPLLQGQWAPPTILGFSVVGAGLLLGSLRPHAAPAAPVAVAAAVTTIRPRRQLVTAPRTPRLPAAARGTRR